MIQLLRRSNKNTGGTTTPDMGTNSAKNAPEDGVVRVSLKSLLDLHHAAESLALKPCRIRALSGGEYRSPFKGRGMEFDEVRAYAQGDDVRTLDWRVMARTGHPHTKLYREERERPVLLFVDMRNAMFFATQGAYKAVRAAQVAALLGWSAVQQGERLGGLVFSEQSHIELRPRRGKPPLLHLLQKLTTHQGWDEHRGHGDPQSLSLAITRLRSVAQPGSLLILVSDFAGLNDVSRAQLAQLSRHSEMLLVDIHDPLEKQLPPPSQYRLSDGETFMTLYTSDSGLRTEYQSRFIQRQDAMRQLCRRFQMTYLALGTEDEPLPVLQRALGVKV
jgi:uncharacterized protein (DUF58 family)